MPDDSFKNWTILVVDDEERMARFIRLNLEHDGFQVSEAYRGMQAIHKLRDELPDLIILDVMMPDMDGFEVLKMIREVSSVPVIMLTAKATEEDLVKGLNLGADDYMTKPFSPRQLLARVQAIQRRVSEEAFPLSSQVSFNECDLIIDSMRHEVKKGGEIVTLTPNEFKLLTILVKYPTKVFTRDELISLAFNDDFQGNDRVVDSHIKNIRQKIESDSRNPQYILTVHGVGYKFGGDCR